MFIFGHHVVGLHGAFCIQCVNAQYRNEKLKAQSPEPIYNILLVNSANNDQRDSRIVTLERTSLFFP